MRLETCMTRGDREIREFIERISIRATGQPAAAMAPFDMKAAPESKMNVILYCRMGSNVPLKEAT